MTADESARDPGDPQAILNLEGVDLIVRANDDLGAVELIINSGDLSGTLVLSPASATKLCAAVLAALAVLPGIEP